MKTDVTFKGMSGYTMIDGILCHYDFEAVYMTAWKEIKYVSSNNRDILWDIDLYASTKDLRRASRQIAERFLSATGMRMRRRTTMERL